LLLLQGTLLQYEKRPAAAAAVVVMAIASLAEVAR
jgi:hypothetical protein